MNQIQLARKSSPLEQNDHQTCLESATGGAACPQTRRIFADPNGYTRMRWNRPDQTHIQATREPKVGLGTCIGGDAPVLLPRDWDQFHEASVTAYYCSYTRLLANGRGTRRNRPSRRWPQRSHQRLVLWPHRQPIRDEAARPAEGRGKSETTTHTHGKHALVRIFSQPTNCYRHTVHKRIQPQLATSGRSPIRVVYQPTPDSHRIAVLISLLPVGEIESTLNTTPGRSSTWLFYAPILPRTITHSAAAKWPRFDSSEQHDTPQVASEGAAIDCWDRSARGSVRSSQTEPP